MTSIYTLGPAGTSSEAAASHYIESNVEPVLTTVGLCGTYEEAQRQLEADLDPGARVVVANAYRDINHFYMSPTVCISDVFRMHTPRYGVAVLRTPRRSQVELTTHPAPVPLIDTLMPPDLTVAKIASADSTAAAAEAVARGEYEAAITTEYAAARCGLHFISKSLSFEMVWTVFKQRQKNTDAIVRQK